MTMHKKSKQIERVELSDQALSDVPVDLLDVMEDIENKQA